MNLAAHHVPEDTTSTEPEANDVMIRSYTAIGSLQSLGKIDVEAREIVVPDRQHVSYFVKVALQSMGDYPQEAVAMVQQANLPRLLGALDKLKKATITTDRFAFSEVEYEVDGLKIIVFNDSRGKLMFVIIAGGVSVHFNVHSRLVEFEDLIIKAKQYIDMRKIEF